MKKKEMSPEEALRAAKVRVGGLMALTRLCQSVRRISHQAVQQWKIVPLDLVAVVAEASGIPAEILRPDLAEALKKRPSKAA